MMVWGIGREGWRRFLIDDGVVVMNDMIALLHEIAYRFEQHSGMN